jgi:uncharacterized SAM-binding protein YcdF (DUF218 family)
MSGVLKYISPLVHPLGLAWLGLLIAAAICLYRRRDLGTLICASLAILLWFVAQPAVVEPLMLRLEQPWTEHTVANAPEADAVVVLGGGWRASRNDVFKVDLTDGVDRWVAGVELCRQGRAKVLVVGGDPPGTGSGGEMAPTEGLQRWLGQWGLGEIETESLGPVRTTREEALRTREMVEARGWRKVLLVTSACHMRRAMATFRKAGVEVEPVACDFHAGRVLGGAPKWSPFPNEEAIEGFGIWWHEQLGWLAYRVMGHL